MITRSDSDGDIVLVVGMSGSIHLARWVAMVRRARYRVVIFPVMRVEPCPELAPYRLVRSREDVAALAPGEVGVFDLDSVSRSAAETIERVNDYKWKGHPAFVGKFNPTIVHKLTRCIRVLKPNLLHSMEVQFAGYMTLEAKRRIGADEFPPWLLSNWGSDVLLFRKLPNHLPVLKEVFQEIDGYWAECARDVAIAHEFDFKGMVFDPMPASGGMVQKRAPATPPSQRRLLLVKGYHGWAGRGFNILSAIYLAAPELRHLEIRVTFADEVARTMMQEMRDRAGLNIEAEGYVQRHDDALDRLGCARMVVGVGISDGISTTLLEAMGTGTFPILADTSCACEWIESGKHGLIVNPHDTAVIAAAMVRAAKDDKLVDSAALRNRREATKRWSASRNAPQVLRSYAEMIERGQTSLASMDGA